jgi:hypothetical protein
VTCDSPLQRRQHFIALESQAGIALGATGDNHLAFPCYFPRRPILSDNRARRPLMFTGMSCWRLAGSAINFNTCRSPIACASLYWTLLDANMGLSLHASVAAYIGPCNNTARAAVTHFDLHAASSSPDHAMSINARRCASTRRT